jgi:hypothetical protein
MAARLREMASTADLYAESVSARSSGAAGVGILQRKPLQVVARAAENRCPSSCRCRTCNRPRARGLPASGKRSWRRETRPPRLADTLKILLLVDQVLDEVRRLQVGERQLARALDLIVHGLENGVGRAALRALGACHAPSAAAARNPGTRAPSATTTAHQQAPSCPTRCASAPHFAPPLLSMEVGSGSSGGRSLRLGLLFDLDFRNQDRRRNRRNRHAARFGAAVAVEDFLLVRSRQDLGEARQRRAHDVRAAHQLVRPAVGIHPVDDHRNHLEGLQTGALRGGEAARDVAEVQAVGLVLLLDSSISIWRSRPRRPRWPIPRSG